MARPLESSMTRETSDSFAGFHPVCQVSVTISQDTATAHLNRH